MFFFNNFTNINKKGEVIGGIIGTDIVRYDIYGRDVLIANKMESNGVSGFVVISQSTKDLVEKDIIQEFVFEKIKEVEIKFCPQPINAYKVFPK